MSKDDTALDMEDAALATPADVEEEAESIVARILDPATDGARYPLYARLREIAPVHRTRHPLLAGWYLISGYENCRKVMLASDAEQNSQMLQMMNVEDDGVHDTMMRRWFNVRDDPAEHDLVRKMFFPYFTPRALADLRAEVKPLIDSLLSGLADRRSFDVMGEFCFPLPSMVIARMLGIPMEDIPRFHTVMEELLAATSRVQVLDAAARARRDETAGAFLNLFRDYLEKRRREPADDLITKAGAAAQAAGLSDDDLLAQFVFILIAGHSTTADSIANALIALDRFPEQRRLLLDGKVGIGKAVDELMRYDASIETVTRYIKRDLPVGDTTMPAGAKAVMLFHSAHRDPAMFEEPDRLDLARGNAGQAFPFGGGRYFCLGQALAKIEVEDALQELLRRFPDYRVREVEWQGGFVSHGPKRLVMQVDAAG